jgi:hypothetical protein
MSSVFNMYRKAIVGVALLAATALCVPQIATGNLGPNNTIGTCVDPDPAKNMKLMCCPDGPTSGRKHFFDPTKLGCAVWDPETACDSLFCCQTYRQGLDDTEFKTICHVTLDDEDDDQELLVPFGVSSSSFSLSSQEFSDSGSDCDSHSDSDKPVRRTNPDDCTDHCIKHGGKNCEYDCTYSECYQRHRCKHCIKKCLKHGYSEDCKDMCYTKFDYPMAENWPDKRWSQDKCYSKCAVHRDGASCNRQCYENTCVMHHGCRVCVMNCIENGGPGADCVGQCTEQWMKGH